MKGADAGSSRRPTPLAGIVLATTLLTAGCWRIGDPTTSTALVTWAAYPETVKVASAFSFEFGGPITPTACGRLDTAIVTVTDSTIAVTAQRSTFDAVCANQHISFYEARALRIPTAGTYRVESPGGRDLGSLIATDSGPFSSVLTQGEGTVRDVESCLLFGPGWIGGQRIFALSRVPQAVRDADGTDRIVYVRGRLRGFTSCGAWGSRPRIAVDTAWVTGQRTGDLYDRFEPTQAGNDSP